MGDEVRRRVLEQVRACLENLTGGSGHLGAIAFDDAGFELLEARAVGAGLTEYRYRLVGEVQSEFQVAGPDADDDGAGPTPAAGGETKEGTLVLDGEFNLTLNANGSVRISPWRCLDPKFWPTGEGGNAFVDDIMKSYEGDDS